MMDSCMCPTDQVSIHVDSSLWSLYHVHNINFSIVTGMIEEVFIVLLCSVMD